MKATVKEITSNRLVKDMALTTVGLRTKTDPTKEWLRTMYLSEHSPIRVKQFIVTIEDLPYWVSVHLVRHFLGVQHFVRSQRDDRVVHDGIDFIPRGELPQEAPVIHCMYLNAQAFINISRKRLCTLASKETRIAWRLVLNELREINPELEITCVPECIYRGFCPELKKCNYRKTIGYKKKLKQYRGEE